MPSVDSSFWGVRREGKFTDLIITVTKVINFHRLGSFTGGGGDFCDNTYFASLRGF